MKIFVTGVKGQLGFDIVNELNKRGHEPIGVDIDELDITREDEYRKEFCELMKKVVID